MSKKVLSQKKSDVKPTEIAPLKKEEVKIPDLTDLIRKQNGEISEALNARSNFTLKQDRLYRQRYGIRKKAVWPWYNASSISMPLQDKHIRALKPEYVSVAYNTYPMCELSTKEAVNEAMSESASYAFDWLMRVKMDCFEPLVLLTDKMLQKGFCIVKVIYEKTTEPKIITIYRDELIKKLQKTLMNPNDLTIITDPARVAELIPIVARQYGLDLEDESDAIKVQNICLELYNGTDIIEFTIQEVQYDAPRWVVLDPEDVIVPPDTQSTFDLEKARWICHQYYVTPAEVLNNMRIGKWKESTCIRILEKAGVYNEDLVDSKYKTNAAPIDDTTMIQQKREREGLIAANTDKNILIKENCVWYDSDGDGVEERYILEYAEGFEEELRFIRYPYHSLKMWPYVKVPFTIEDTGHYSNRGSVELEEPLAVALNVQHNMKINRQTIASTPTLLYAANKVNPNNFQYIPGQPVPVEPPINQNAQWFMPQSTDLTFMQEEEILKNWSEQMLAANDYGPMQAKSGDKTATEINYNQNSRVGIRQLDIQIFQRALKEIYRRTFSLWIEFSSDAVFEFTDSDGTTKLIDKAALMRDYQFQPMGSFGSSNPQLSAQIAQRMFELFQMDPMIDTYEIYREFITKQGDARLTKRILKSKAQIQQDQQAAADQAKAAHQQALQEELALTAAGVEHKDRLQAETQAKSEQKKGMQQITGGNPKMR